MVEHVIQADQRESGPQESPCQVQHHSILTEKKFFPPFKQGEYFLNFISSQFQKKIYLFCEFTGFLIHSTNITYEFNARFYECSFMSQCLAIQNQGSILFAPNHLLFAQRSVCREHSREHRASCHYALLNYY